jgi:hypothetical protein
MGNINISTARTKAYANEQRTMNNEHRTSSKTNPIKANLPDTEMSATFCDKRDYENIWAFGLQENEAKSNPISNDQSQFQTQFSGVENRTLQATGLYQPDPGGYSALEKRSLLWGSFGVE